MSVTAAGDIVYTPDWVAADMLAHFRPSGTILDPCRGKGAFHKQLPEGSPWCEITEGRDFFAWTDPVAEHVPQRQQVEHVSRERERTAPTALPIGSHPAWLYRPDVLE